MKTWKPLTLFALLLAASSANALTGMALLDLLRSPDPVNHHEALRYIQGVVDAFATDYGYGQVSKCDHVKACPPEDVTYEQSAEVARKYLSDHPENLQAPAAGLTILAISRAWPCPGLGGRQ